MESERTELRQAILDFIRFEEETSRIWPWAISAETIIQSDEMLKEIECTIRSECEESFDADNLYDAIDRVAGVNPELEATPSFGAGMIFPGL